MLLDFRCILLRTATININYGNVRIYRKAKVKKKDTLQKLSPTVILTRVGLTMGEPFTSTPWCILSLIPVVFVVHC